MMKASIYLTISTAFLFRPSTGSNVSPAICSRSGPLHFRAPPSLTNVSSAAAAAAWQFPPSGFPYGNWKLSHTSQPGYADWYNPEIDLYPILPTNNMSLVDMIDLYSWQYANSSRILTVYAIDKPLPEIGPYAFNDTISGAINDTTIFNWMAWGTDTSGYDFFALFAGAAEGTLYFEPEIDIFSRADEGISDTTLSSIKYCIANAGISELNGLVAKVYKSNFDGRRVGMPPASCNETCMQNENA